ncbi:hypothetical protein J6590_020038 [Homalodisca vitripennis]|nr:hypothetical protein J6590_020038 [Homalodisca vitripennis]
MDSSEVTGETILGTTRLPRVHMTSSRRRRPSRASYGQSSLVSTLFNSASQEFHLYYVLYLPLVLLNKFPTQIYRL